MDAGQTRKFRALLLDTKRELLDMEQTLGDAGRTVELDQARVGRLSRMDAMQGQQMALETGRRRKRQLVAIDAALGRIDIGEFGICAACGEDIGAPRLGVDPTITLCIACAEQAHGS